MREECKIIDVKELSRAFMGEYPGSWSPSVDSIRGTNMACSRSTERIGGGLSYTSAMGEWRARHHRAPIKCRVCASLLSCSRMRYAGALSAGIITNCRSSFDRLGHERSSPRDRRIISKNNCWNHVLLNRKQNDSQGKIVSE